MAYRKIEEIVINGNSGEIFDSYIYGSNLELGFSESPTKLTLNIVKKDSSDFTEFPISLLNSYEIKIGKVTLSKMYLYSYEISRSVGQKTATLNFIDPSFILDKIFVGLIYRHYSPGDITYTSANYFNEDALIKSLPPETIEILKTFLVVDVDLKRGGSIMLGRPSYVGDQKDNPDITYNFTELLQGISKAGINISGLVDISPDYFQSYVGTLREVLSNWCADFGYTFYWDITTNSIKGIDLKIEVDYINEIKSLISQNSALNVNMTNEETLAIESFNESKSLEGTVTQKHISRYLKSAKRRDESSQTINRKTFSCLTPEKIGCTEDDMIRAVLGKYSPDARTTYSLYQQDYKPLGFEILSIVEEIFPKTKNDSLLAKIVQAGFSNDAITEFLDKYNGGIFFIGILNTKKQQLWLDWESEIANMLGKYYYTPAVPVAENYSLTPNAQYYSSKNQFALPFSKVLEGPIASDLRKQAESLKAELKQLENETSDAAKQRQLAAEKELEKINEQLEAFEFKSGNVNILTRESAYGQDQNDYDAAMLDEFGEDVFAPYKIKTLPIEGVAYTLLVGAKDKAKCTGDSDLAKKIEDIITNINSLKNINNNTGDSNGERSVVIALAPSREVLKNVIAASFLKGEGGGFSTRPNTRECKKDEDDGEQFVGLSSSYGRVIQLQSISRGSKIELILPAENIYLGILSISRTSINITPGQNIVYGKIGSIDDNTMSLQVAESDITNDLDLTDTKAIQEGTFDTIIAAIDPDSIGIGLNSKISYKYITGSKYHAEITKKIVNSITIPRKTLNLSIIGLNYGGLDEYFSQNKGLNSISINLNENGATSQITFANRPKILPKREAVSQKIQPTIRLATWRS